MTSAPPCRVPHGLRARRESSPWPYRRRLWIAAAAATAVHAALYFFSGESLVTGVEYGMEDPGPAVDVELVEHGLPEPVLPAPVPVPPTPEVASTEPVPVPEPPRSDDVPPPQPEPTEVLQPVAKPVPPKPRAVANPFGTARARPVGSTAGSSGASTAGSTTGPGHLYNPKPAYPPESRAAGEQGIVVLRVVIQANGRPGSITLSRGSGHPRLDRTAEEAVRRWRFKPATRDGQPFATSVDVPVRFSLR